MNFDRTYYGRLNINESKINLGCAELDMLLRRATNQLAKAATPRASKLQITMEFSTVPLLDASILNHEQALVNEMQSLMVEDSEEIYPGITAKRVAEVFVTPQCEAYRKLCHPQNRIGIPPDEVRRIIDEYRAAFPDCIPHFPLWVDS